MRICSQCREVKSEEDFPLISKDRGRRSVCKVCHNLRNMFTPEERAARRDASRARLAEAFKHGIGPKP